MDGFFGISSTMGEAFRALGDREICLRLVMKGVGIRGIRDMIDVMNLKMLFSKF